MTPEGVVHPAPDIDPGDDAPARNDESPGRGRGSRLTRCGSRRSELLVLEERHRARPALIAQILPARPILGRDDAAPGVVGQVLPARTLPSTGSRRPRRRPRGRWSAAGPCSERSCPGHVGEIGRARPIAVREQGAPARIRQVEPARQRAAIPEQREEIGPVLALHARRQEVRAARLDGAQVHVRPRDDGEGSGPARRAGRARRK